MRKAILIASSFLLIGQIGANAQTARKCGIQELKEALIAKHPAFAQAFAQEMEQQKLDAAAYKAAKNTGLAKATNSIGTIPVVFHIVLDSAQIAQLGGASGIAQRAISQVDVINRDFNAENADSTQIPAAFKPLYANVGIHFGLAHRKPDGTSTNGYEIITTSVAGFNFNGSAGSQQFFSDAKYDSSGIVNTWDPTIYLNVWIINPQNPSDVLGMTSPHSFLGSYGMPLAEMGIVINYGAFGVKTSSSQYFISGATNGRTLTHELGHFFEIWHTWGDDGGLCPWNGGDDDGIADTPPQATMTYGDPTGPIHDACDSNQSDPGIMWMNYMDYVNDASMHLFTNDQATMMQTQVQSGHESYSLTQHPDVLQYPAAVTQIEKNNNYNVVPNPTNGLIKIYFDQTPEQLQGISVVNMLGQTIYKMNTASQQSTSYSIDLSAMSKGIYFVQCHFTDGAVTRKIVLQ